MSDKRYSKEEVVELIHEYRNDSPMSNEFVYHWLNNKGLKPNNNRKQYSVQDEIERKERIVEDNTPSYDKVMKAIERAEDRERMNSCLLYTSPSPRD